MSTKYDAFLPHVLPHVPNCFEEQAIVAIRNACIDFCRDTLVLQQDIDPITMVAGIGTYELEVTRGYVPGQVLGLYYLARKLERKSQLELERLYTRNWQSIDGTPQVYTQFNFTEITFAPKPNETVRNAVTGRMSYLPSRSSTEIDDLIFERYLDEIVVGAVARLMATPNQPYTDAEGSNNYARIFSSKVAQARAFVQGGMNHAPMRVRFQRIW